MAEFRRVLLDGVVTQIERHGETFRTADGRPVDVQTAQHLPPCDPTKIICVHLAYWSRVKELGSYSLEAPTYFHKPISCLNSHRGTVLRPAGCRYLNYEGEVAIVIGRTTRSITPDEAPDYIRGYTMAIDFGLHDFRDTDGNSMLRVKGSDTLGVVGPGLVTDWDPLDKPIQTLVNGTVVQDDTTAGMLWPMNYFVADLARLITLEPGDLILTGTPANSRPVQPGDTVAVRVEGLGELTAAIAAGPPVASGFGAMPADSDAIRGVALGIGLKQ